MLEKFWNFFFLKSFFFNDFFSQRTYNKKQISFLKVITEILIKNKPANKKRKTNQPQGKPRNTQVRNLTNIQTSYHFNPIIPTHEISYPRKMRTTASRERGEKLEKMLNKGYEWSG